jgi:hypothetical protein
MSQAVLAPLPTGTPYFEQQIFTKSPFGGVVTAVLLFAAPYALYLGIGVLSDVPTIQWNGHGLTFSNGAWPALVLSLLVAAALSMQRYARLGDARERGRFSEIFSGGDETAARLASYRPNNAKLGVAGLAGIVLGLTGSALVLTGQSEARPPAIMGWFVVMITLSAVLFARGAELTRAASTSFSATLRDELKIDLLRIDRLSALGRSSARAALIWFVVSAVTCLFFVGGDIDLPSVAIMLACAGMGLWIFAIAILHVHREIMAAKAAELEHLRREIDAARANLKTDPASAMRIHGLVAYEARITAAPEWPFDQTTLFRVAASTLIVTVPWFGQALAGYAIDHLAH